MHEPEFILFASDAEIMAIWGGAFLLLAMMALVAERLRVKRRKIDAVGWVPWTPIFVCCAFIGASLMMVAFQGWNSP